jgi:hypothetical protein
MTIGAAWRDGARRVNRAGIVLVGVWLMTILISLPMALVLHGMIAQHLGDSLAADSAAAGANYEWMQEFADQASGVGVTFKPTIIGFGAVLDNLSAFLDASRRPLVVGAVAAVYVGLWLFVAGGVIDRMARDRVVGASGFFAASGVYFWRFLRLGILQLAVYWLLFGSAHAFLFDRVYRRATHDMNVEREAFAVRVALYVIFAALVGAANLIFDYAKIRAVVEDRRSMLSALGAAMRFVGRNSAALGLYIVNVIVFLLCLAAYALVAPGARGSGTAAWIGFSIGQAYILVRLWIKLVFWASETSLFQARLAHAGYVAAPVPTWPDSPSAEAIAQTSASL